MNKEEAIKIVRSHYPANKQMLNEALEFLIPELKESEDEKIRKEIIAIFKGQTSFTTEEDGKKYIEWLEKQGDKDKLIQELGEYKVKYTQEVLEQHINSMGNKDDERLRKTTIAFLKDFVEQGYENAVECIDWLEKQGEQKSIERKDFISIPFGTDSELIEETITIPDGCYAYITGNKIYIHKNEQKQDPCRDCDHPMLNCHYFPCTTKKAFEQNNLVTTK